MADIAGFTGAFSTTNTTNDGAVTSWSGTLSIDNNKIEPAFGGKWRRTILGAGEFTGSFTANLESGAANNNPFPDISGTDWANLSVTSMVLTANTGCTYTFDAVLSNLSTSYTNGGVAQLTGDFANSDTDFAVAWAEV